MITQYVTDVVGPKRVPRSAQCRWAVYCLLDDSKPLYVGQTKNLSNRLRAHRAPRSPTRLHSSWCAWVVESPDEALRLESALIRWLQPSLNRAGR